jgi:hypothetical protein
MHGLQVVHDPIAADIEQPIRDIGIIARPGFLLLRPAGVIVLAPGLTEAEETRAIGVALTYHLRLADELPERFPLRLADYPTPPLPAGHQVN